MQPETTWESFRKMLPWIGLVMLLAAILGAEIDLALGVTSPWRLSPGAVVSLVPLLIFVYLFVIPVIAQRPSEDAEIQLTER